MGWMFLFFAFVLAVAGYLIRFRGKVELIAGYESGEFEDEAALAVWFGNRLFVAAGIALVFAPLAGIYKGFELYFLLGYIAILILGGMFNDFSEEDVT